MPLTSNTINIRAIENGVKLVDSSIDGRFATVSPLGDLKITESSTLVGSSFQTTTVEGTYWIGNTSGSGSITEDGDLIISTGTTADSLAEYTSVSKGRKTPGTSMQFRTICSFSDSSIADNIRQIGIYDGYDGFLFELDSGVFSVVSIKNTVENRISSGSFNGDIGSTYVMDEHAHRMVIQYTEFSTEFYIDGQFLHRISAGDSALTETLNLPIKFINENYSGQDTDVSISSRFATIVRLGKFKTGTKSKFINIDSTNTLRYSAGLLISIINLNNAGTITIYDATSAVAGTELAIIDASKVLGTISFNIDFNNGLTVVTNGATCTVVFS